LIAQAHRKYASLQIWFLITKWRPIENNPFTGTQTYTNFTGVASGKFPELAQRFYKTHMPIMMKEFMVFQILAHVVPNVQNWLW
jgi:alpha-amylase